MIGYLKKQGYLFICLALIVALMVLTILLIMAPISVVTSILLSQDGVVAKVLDNYTLSEVIKIK